MVGKYCVICSWSVHLFIFLVYCRADWACTSISAVYGSFNILLVLEMFERKTSKIFYVMYVRTCIPILLRYLSRIFNYLYFIIFIYCICIYIPGLEFF